MALEKVNYVSHKTKISAKNLNDIQDAIIEMERIVAMLVPKRSVDVDVLAKKWILYTDGVRHYQAFEIDGVTEQSLVTLQISSEQAVIFREKDFSLTVENHGGTVMIFLVGTVPENDYTVQCTIEEVAL